MFLCSHASLLIEQSTDPSCPSNVSEALPSAFLAMNGTFFDAIGDIVMFFFKVFAKFIGVLLIIIGAITLIGLLIGLFSLGIVNTAHIPGLDIIDVFNNSGTPIWLASLLIFFTVGIPFFFLFYLGLKILINNLKSIGNIAKFTLLGLWLMSIIALVIIGIRQASEHAFEESYIEKTEIPITQNDTLTIKMVDNDKYTGGHYQRHNSVKITHDDNGEKILYSSDVEIFVKSTTDSVATVSVIKNADGRNYDTAIERAKNIHYNFEFKDNTLLLDTFLTTHIKNKFSDQEIEIILYIPENTMVYFTNNTKHFLHYRKYDGNIISSKTTNHYLKILENNSECLDCPKPEDDFKVKVNTQGLKINDDGIEINADDAQVKIDYNGIKAESDDVKVNINADGIDIQTEN